MPRSLSPFAQHAHILSYRTKIHRLRPCPLAGSRESIGYFQSGGSPVNENVETEINHMLGFSHHLLTGSIDTSSLEIYGRNLLAYLHFAETKEAALSPSTLASWIEYLAATGAYTP